MTVPAEEAHGGRLASWARTVHRPLIRVGTPKGRLEPTSTGARKRWPPKAGEASRRGVPRQGGPPTRISERFGLATPLKLLSWKPKAARQRPRS